VATSRLLEHRRCQPGLLSPMKAPRCSLLTVADVAHNDLITDELDCLLHAETATELASTTGVRDKRPVLDLPRITGLVDFHRDCTAVAVHAPDSIISIGSGAAAPTN